MVNDQLIRIHHMRLLSYDKMMTENQRQKQRQQNLGRSSPSQLEHCSSNQSNPRPSPNVATNGLSSSAPETGLFGEHLPGKQDYLSSSTNVTENFGRNGGKQTEVASSPLSKSQSFSPSKDFSSDMVFSHDSNDSGGSSGGGKKRSQKKQKQQREPNQQQQQQQTKRRSSWRHLLSPSYKSRSDEFHKFFADEIPDSERLIADYSCALHREILIQGRVYVSINYVAFYSNLFSWITKLVLRLADITDIFKANTARIIPNAIQIVTNSGDKHVFASFIARDRSYVMIWRLWRKNLLQDLMSNQEIRSLLHLSYGKDLGVDNEEDLRIGSETYGSAPPSPMDGNNNSSSEIGHDLHGGDRSICDRLDSVAQTQHDNDASQETAPANQQQLEPVEERVGDNELNATRSSEGDGGHKLAGDADICCSPQTTSSAVVIDTPELGKHEGSLEAQDEDRNLLESANISGPDGDDGKQTAAAANDDGDGRGEGEQASRASHSADLQVGVSGETVTQENSSSQRVESGQNTAGQVEASPAMPEASPTISCNCDQHQGLQIADEQFDVDVDTLFSLIFTNSKFMRAYMVRRGMTDTIVSNWKRSTGATVSSSGAESSSLSRCLELETDESSSLKGTTAASGRRNSIDSLNIHHAPRPAVRSKQVRQLNYSMNLNHLWAKQVQVEERQNILSAQRGAMYVLKSQTINSGVPCSETFTVDMTYCLTRIADHRSRLLVHGGVNFIKDKQSWKLAMVKSMIEKQSVQGMREFVSELIVCIREYVSKKRAGATGSEHDDGVSLFAQHEEEPGEPGDARQAKLAADDTGRSPQTPAALARAKSKLKERKLRNMYKYYVRSASLGSTTPAGHHHHQESGHMSESSLDSSSPLNDFEHDHHHHHPHQQHNAAADDDDDSMIMMRFSSQEDEASGWSQASKRSFTVNRRHSHYPHHLSGSASETSNMTINDGHSLACDAKYGLRTRPSTTARPRAKGNQAQAQARRKQPPARPTTRRHRNMQPGPLGDLLSNKNLLTYSALALVLLFAGLLFSNMLLLHRMANIEAQLLRAAGERQANAPAN